MIPGLFRGTILLPAAGLLPQALAFCLLLLATCAPVYPVPDAPPNITLAETLRAAGYKTMHAGIWHLGDTPDLYPEHQGFDVNIAGHKAGKPNTYFSPYDLPGLENGPPGEYLTDRLTSEGIHFMKENRDGPFFLYMSYHSPHTPLQAKDSLVWKYIPKPHDNGQFDSVYAAMIESLDQNVGRLMDCLESLGLTGRTIVVFYSDNGTAPFVAPEEPFRGFKGTLYEGGIKVALIIKWTESQGGQTTATPVTGIDLYPTLIDLAGLDTPGEAGELFDLLQGWRSAMGVTYPLEKNPDFDAASIPARFKAGGRSDIYKPRFKKEK